MSSKGNRGQGRVRVDGAGLSARLMGNDHVGIRVSGIRRGGNGSEYRYEKPIQGQGTQDNRQGQVPKINDLTPQWPLLIMVVSFTPRNEITKVRLFG